MKKLIAAMFIAVLSIVALPVSSVSATDGVGGDGGSGSSTQPNSEFEVVDLATGEVFKCKVITLSGSVWTIECVSQINGDVFFVRVYVLNGVIVHEVTVTKVVSSGATVEGLRNRATGLGHSIRNKSPFGQTNYNVKLVGSGAVHNVAVTQTSGAAHAEAEAERQRCLGYFPGDPRCQGGYNNFKPALNTYLAYARTAAAGFQTGVPYPVYAASFFPAYPTPGGETVPATGSDGGLC